MNALERLARALQQREERERSGENASQRRNVGSLWAALKVLRERTWYGYEMVSADGERFDYQSDTAPAGWTVAQAPAGSGVGRGYWTLKRDAGSWFVYKRLSTDFEANVTPGYNAWWMFGPCVWSDEEDCQMDHSVGICPDNAGSINTAIYARCHMRRDAVSGAWSIRGEKDEGSGEVAGSWLTLSWPVVQPLWFYVKLWENRTIDFFLVPNPMWGSGHRIWRDTFSPTVGVPWVTLSSDRGVAGVEFDYFSIGGVDQIGLD
jgi:hypothetical protein